MRKYKANLELMAAAAEVSKDLLVKFLPERKPYG
jgi:hypothetical protein